VLSHTAKSSDFLKAKKSNESNESDDAVLEKTVVFQRNVY
jgi:hypothetical protein